MYYVILFYGVLYYCFIHACVHTIVQHSVKQYYLVHYTTPTPNAARNVIVSHRSFRLRSNEKSTVLGIDAYRFRVEASEFQPNPSYWTHDGVTPNGLLYLGVLQQPNAPIYASKPHFLDCDPSLRTKMEGIREADRSKDDIFVDIEPV